MTMKRNAALLGAMVVLCFVQSCASSDIDVQTPNFTGLPDGAYTGSFDGGLVKATVNVAIAGGRIEKVTIVSHKCGKGKPAEVIVNDVVKRQSLDVDAVSGATRSSKVILKAIEVALTQ